VDRFKDHLRFAVCFAGAGYLVLWPLAAAGRGGALFGASLLCGDGVDVLDRLCRSAHPLTLSPALHAMGFVSALAAGMCLLRGLLRRLRRRSAATATPLPVSPHLPRPTATLPPPLPTATPSLSTPVPPRRHFGLRGSETAAQASDMA
jgi:hypothetical protein